MQYREEKQGKTITLWDNTEGIDLQFQEGETLQAYTSSQVIKDASLASTESGLQHLNEVTERLQEYAAQHYPKEFAPLK